MTPHTRAHDGQGRGWPAPLRVMVSLGLAVHLAAVVLPPLASPPLASLLANQLIQPLRPYVGLLYLWHGYRFFAPDPGPGHSLRWSLVTAEGVILDGSIPDADSDWPRLMYHRRFMIPEKLSGMIPPIDAPEEIRREARLDWGPLVEAVAAELLSRYQGVTVSLDMVEHYLPTPGDIIDRRENRPAAAPDAWRDRVTPLGTYALTTAAEPASSEPASSLPPAALDV